MLLFSCGGAAEELYSRCWMQPLITVDPWGGAPCDRLIVRGLSTMKKLPLLMDRSDLSSNKGACRVGLGRGPLACWLS